MSEEILSILQWNTSDPHHDTHMLTNLDSQRNVFLYDFPNVRDEGEGIFLVLPS